MIDELNVTTTTQRQENIAKRLQELQDSLELLATRFAIPPVDTNAVNEVDEKFTEVLMLVEESDSDIADHMDMLNMIAGEFGNNQEIENSLKPRFFIGLYTLLSEYNRFDEIISLATWIGSTRFGEDGMSTLLPLEFFSRLLDGIEDEAHEESNRRRFVISHRIAEMFLELVDSRGEAGLELFKKFLQKALPDLICMNDDEDGQNLLEWVTLNLGTAGSNRTDKGDKLCILSHNRLVREFAEVRNHLSKSKGITTVIWDQYIDVCLPKAIVKPTLPEFYMHDVFLDGLMSIDETCLRLLLEMAPTWIYNLKVDGSTIYEIAVQNFEGLWDENRLQSLAPVDDPTDTYPYDLL